MIETTAERITKEQNRLLDHLLRVMKLKNDAALGRRLGIAPPVVSKLRHGTSRVRDLLLINMHEESGLNIKDLKDFLPSDDKLHIQKLDQFARGQADRSAQAAIVSNEELERTKAKKLKKLKQAAMVKLEKAERASFLWHCDSKDGQDHEIAEKIHTRLKRLIAMSKGINSAPPS